MAVNKNRPKRFWEERFVPENSPEKMNIAMEHHHLEDEIHLQNGCLEESVFIGSTPPAGSQLKV